MCLKKVQKTTLSPLDEKPCYLNETENIPWVRIFTKTPLANFHAYFFRHTRVSITDRVPTESSQLSSLKI